MTHLQKMPHIFDAIASNELLCFDDLPLSAMGGRHTNSSNGNNNNNGTDIKDEDPLDMDINSMHTIFDAATDIVSSSAAAAAATTTTAAADSNWMYGTPDFLGNAGTVDRSNTYNVHSTIAYGGIYRNATNYATNNDYMNGDRFWPTTGTTTATATNTNTAIPESLIPEPTPIEPSRVQVVHRWSPKDSLASMERHGETSSLIQLFHPLLYSRNVKNNSNAVTSTAGTISAPHHNLASASARSAVPFSHQLPSLTAADATLEAIATARADDIFPPFQPEIINSVASSTNQKRSRNEASVASNLMSGDAFIGQPTKRSKTNPSFSPTKPKSPPRAKAAVARASLVSSSASTVSTSSSAASTTQSSPPRQPKFRTFQEDLWSHRFQELCEFSEQHGHCLVPTKYAHNLQLSQWVKRQRYHYKLRKNGTHSNLTAERQQALEDAGFCWDMHSALWQERLQELVAYKQQHGDCNVRCHFPRNPQLAVWVKYQRRQYKLLNEGKPSNMTEARIEKLNGLGFVWHCRASK